MKACSSFTSMSLNKLKPVYYLQCVFCLTIGSLPRPTDLVVGLTAAIAWELPNKIDKKLTKLLHRRSRSTLFPRIEAFLQS